MADPDVVSSGGMVALLPADPGELVVDHPQADPAGEMHCTLAYLGPDVTGWDSARRALVVDAVRRAAAETGGPIAAHVAGHATFNPTGGPDGDRDPCAVHLIGDSDALTPLLERVRTGLALALGADFRAQHTPTIFHVTAGYGLTANDLSYAGPVVFDRVLIAIAGERTTIPLAAPSAAAETVRRVRELVDLHGHDHATTGTLAAVLATRAATWQANRTRLRAAVHAYTSTAPADLIREPIDPTGPRNVRKAQAGLALAATLHASGHADGWRAANTACRTTAYEAGARAAAHTISGGAVPIDAETAATEKWGIPGWVSAAAAAAVAAILAKVLARRRGRVDTDPDTDLDDQLDGVAGDLADLYRSDPDGVTDDDIEAALEEAAGVDAYADMQWSEAFLEGAGDVYADAGVTLVNWFCCEVPCAACLDLIDRNPYQLGSEPGPLHPNCETWIEPAGSVPAVDNAV